MVEIEVWKVNSNRYFANALEFCTYEDRDRNLILLFISDLFTFLINENNVIIKTIVMKNNWFIGFWSPFLQFVFIRDIAAEANRYFPLDRTISLESLWKKDSKHNKKRKMIGKMYVSPSILHISYFKSKIVSSNHRTKYIITQC